MSREILLLCLAGGICALDTTAAWQLMLSQPLVSGTIAGLVLGVPQVGVFVGLVLQLLWSGAIPVGARPMPDAPVGTVAGVWLAATLLGTAGLVSPSFCYLAGLISALCFALAGRWTVMLEREISRRLYRRFAHGVSLNQEVGPDKVVWLALMIAFARGFVLSFLAISVLAPVAHFLADNPSVSMHDYGLTLLVLEALGAGVLFSVFVRKSRARFLALGGGVVWAILVMRLSHG